MKNITRIYISVTVSLLIITNGGLNFLIHDTKYGWNICLGEFKEGAYQGHGIRSFADGDKYEG